MAGDAITANTVRDMLRQLRGVGLEVRKETGSGHWKIHDPESGAWLFNVSSSPSDTNWHWAVKRHLRRLGFLGPKPKSKRQKVGVIDMEALAKAQEAAAARGERVPSLDDLEDSTEFFSRIKTGTAASSPYTFQAQDEAVEMMVARADSPRFAAMRQRLRQFMVTWDEELIRRARDRATAEGRTFGVKKGQGGQREFVRIAIEVGHERGLRVWKSLGSGEQTIYKLLSEDDGGAAIWVVNLLDAAMDHIEGMGWGDVEPEPVIDVPVPAYRIDEDDYVEVGGMDAGIEVGGTTHEPLTDEEKPWETRFNELEAATGELLAEAERQVGQAVARAAAEEAERRLVEAKLEEAVRRSEEHASTNGAGLRERYADALLGLLGTYSPDDAGMVLDRLDRLVGIGGEES